MYVAAIVPEGVDGEFFSARKTGSMRRTVVD
jgi:hypothetical protein